jgi:RimJ/RimL family protein N-acetyltransferase
MIPELRTKRLVLRAWQESDLEPFAALNCDPRVMEHLPAVLSRAESDAAAARARAHFDEHGFGFWAVQVVGGASFIGFAGLARPRFDASFTPCVEIGWRLAREHWGRGYATEAARGALRFAFDDLALDEVLAWTVPANRRSLRVMDKLGMCHDPTHDFDHPRLPEGHPLRRHLLYRIGRVAFAPGERTARIADLTEPARMDVVRDLFREYQRTIGVDLCFQGFAEELATLPGAYAPPRGRLLLATIGDDPVGCVGLRPLDGDAAEMKRLYVRPAARGQGLGRRLATSVIDGARALGYRCVRLDTLASMTDAIALYRALGFVEIPPYRPNPLPGPRYFERTLDRG